MKNIYRNIFLACCCLPVFTTSFAQELPAQYITGIKKNYMRTWDATAPEPNVNTLTTRPLKDVKQSTQYFDGLGRPLQTVVKQGSLPTDPLNPTSSAGALDLVRPVIYDGFGREVNRYLPFAANNTGGNSSITDGGFKMNPFQQQATFMNAEYTGQGETWFYSKTVYELSPADRVRETFAPGNSWSGTSGETNENNRHSVKIKYWNNANADSVKKWNVTDVANNWGNYTVAGTYPAAELTKTITVDEQGKQVIQFIDKEGKVILKKVQLTATADNGSGSSYTGWLCTYYIYDVVGNLRCVVQPRGVELLVANGWNITALNNDILNEQCFRYEYDYRDRMIMKKVPGADEVYMVYDARDLLVMWQDANLRYQNKWMVTLYDGLNRPVQTGKLLNTYNNKTFTQHRTDAAVSTAYPFAVTATPSTTYWEYLSKTGYDDYSTIPSASLLNNTFDATWASYFTSTYNTAPDYAQQQTASLYTSGMITWTETKVLNSNPAAYLYTVNIYDEKGRLIQVKSKNMTGGTDVTTTQYNWVGQPLTVVQKHEKANVPAQTSEVITRLTYDDLGRLVKTEKKVKNSLVNSNNLPAEWTVISEQLYDKSGQLKTKTIGAKKDLATNTYLSPRQPLQTLSFDYNIRGWLLGMNREYLATEGQTSDGISFGYELAYDKLTNKAAHNFTGTGQFNGNIGGMLWKSDGDDTRRKYDFSYDAADRLLKANFEQHNSDDHTWSNAKINYTVLMGDGSSPTTAYDANGNIKSMTQYGFKAGGNPQTPIDQLTYNYKNGGNSNKLLNVIDAQNDAATQLGDFRTSLLHPVQLKNTLTEDYTYDLNGNLTKDLNKDIGDANNSGISYNYLNLPEIITVKTTGGAVKGTITYTYDAVGNKLKKETVENASSANGNITTTTTTTYIGGFVYESKTDNNAQTTDYTDQLQFIGHEEGRIRFTPVVGTFQASLNYDYFIKDHLGNVRMVLTEEQSINYYPASTLEGTWDVSTNSMVNYERKFYNIDQSKITAETSIPSWGTETVANTKLYYNHNGIPPSSPNPSYPAGVSPTQTTGSTKLYKLNATSNKTGLEFVMKVMAGDKIDIFGKSYYLNTTTVSNSNSTAMDLLGMFTSLLLSPANAVGAKGVTASQLQSWNLGLVPGTFFRGNNNETGTTVPKAYINYIFLDEQFKYVSGGASRVGSSGVVKNHWTEDAVLQNISVQKSGYLFVYVSNESNFDVFFDNLQVVHKPGMMVEETHYYPYGLTMAGISSKALKPNYAENKKKYNGIEFDSTFGFDIYEADLRYLDPQTARWWQIDPLTENTEIWSPYASNYDNPIRYSDPRGDEGQQCCGWLKELVNDVKDAVVETGEGIYNGAVKGARFVNTYLNPLTPIVEMVTGKSVESDFTEAKPRMNTAPELLMTVIPGGRTEAAIIKAEMKAAEKAATLQANKIAGRKFEKELVEEAKKSGDEVAEQLTIKTKDGIKTKVDIARRNSEGTIKLTEAKASETATLTGNQRKAHPQIAEEGGTVVGKGKPGFPGGTNIPPTKVEVVRKKNN